MVTLGELMMILELHRQGLKVSAIARQLGIDRKTVRRYRPVALGESAPHSPTEIVRNITPCPGCRPSIFLENFGINGAKAL